MYGLRINNVIEPHEYESKFPAFVAGPGLRRRNIFAYIDAPRPSVIWLTAASGPTASATRFQRLERRHVGGHSQ